MFINNDGFYKDKEGFWFVGRSNAVLYYLKEDFECTPVSFLSEDGGDSYRLYQQCVVCNDKVYCLPDRSNNLAVYDITQNQLDKIYIDAEEKRRLSILSAYDIDGTLWCVSNGLGKIIEFSLSNESVDGIYEIFNRDNANQDEYSGEESVVVDNKIICVSKYEATVAIFDVSSRKVNRIRLKLDEKGFNTILYKNGTYILSGYKSNIYLWDGQSDNVESIALEEEICTSSFNYDLPVFIHSCCVGEKVIFSFFDQQVGSGLFAFGLDNRKVYRILDNDKEVKPGEHYVFECFSDEGVLIHLDNDQFAGYLIENDLALKREFGMRRVWKTNTILNDLKRNIKDKMFYEAEEFGIDDYIQVLKRM